MTSMKEISTSILVSDGVEMKAGVLSILQKKGKMLKSSSYELHPLYWRLVIYARQVYLLGYAKHLPGAKATKKLLVRACPKDMKLPEKVIVSSNDSFLCIQCGEKTIFLKADSRSQRNKWVHKICSALEEPVYESSALSTASTDSSDTFDVLRDPHDHGPTRSVRNTADTKANPGNDWRRNNTSPPGQFQPLSTMSSVSTIPSSAKALAIQQKQRRAKEMAHATGLKSQQSDIRSLNSIDRPRSLSQLDPHGIYGEGAQYSGIEYNDLASMSSLSLSASNITTQPNPRIRDDPVSKRLYTKRSRARHSNPEFQGFQPAEGSNGYNEPKYDYPYDEGQLDEEEDKGLTFVENFYMPLKDDDQSTVSYVHNLSPAPRGNTHLYDDTAPPELPERDYQNYPINNTDRPMTPECLKKKKPSKKSRAPQPPKDEVPLEQMDSIEREKTVCLEAAGYQRENEPKDRGIDKSNSNRGNKNRLDKEYVTGTREPETFNAYIQRFRSELFDKDGVSVEVPKTDLSPEKIKLVCVGDCICVAELPNPNLHSLLHIDDVIVRVNLQNLPSIDFCYELFRTTEKDKVQLLVKRVVHGTLCHVELTTNGDIDSLGLEFGNQSQGIEVTSMHGKGLVAKSGNLRSQTHGITNGGVPVNWGLVEVNQSPVPLGSSPTEVRFQVRRAGCELALVFLPMDIVNAFKEKRCEKESQQTDDKC